MKVRKVKQAYTKKDGTVVKAHSQGYTWKEFMKLKRYKREKGLPDLKRAGKDWKTAKTMSKADVDKNYGLFDFGISAKLSPPKIGGKAEVDLD